MTGSGNGDGRLKAIGWIAERVGVPSLLLAAVLWAGYFEVIRPLREETVKTLKDLRSNTTTNAQTLDSHDKLLQQIKVDGVERTSILREIQLEQQRTTQAILQAK